jgi:hypothetical protein
VKKSKTPTFLLELPLQVNAQQAKHLRAHFEAGRCLYNALLGEAIKRLKQMRADPRWQQARRIPKTQKPQRSALFSQLRQEYGFSEYGLHAYATSARTAWIADHIDANTAQKLATRAYQAAHRVCLGQAKHVRFKSKGRGLDSVEGKNNKQGLRFVLQTAEEGNTGWLVWQHDQIPALIDWHDPVIKHGLDQRMKLSQYCHGCGSYVNYVDTLAHLLGGAPSRAGKPSLPQLSRPRRAGPPHSCPPPARP